MSEIKHHNHRSTGELYGLMKKASAVFLEFGNHSSYVCTKLSSENNEIAMIMKHLPNQSGQDFNSLRDLDNFFLTEFKKLHEQFIGLQTEIDSNINSVSGGFEWIKPLYLQLSHTATLLNEIEAKSIDTATKINKIDEELHEEMDWLKKGDHEMSDFKHNIRSWL